MLFNQYSESAHDFCAELYRGCTTGYVNIWTKDRFERKDSFTVTLTEAMSPELSMLMAELADRNVYVQVTPVASTFSGGARGSLEHVAMVQAFFADIDFKHPDKKGTILPLDGDDALKLFEPGGFLPPTLIVETGRGFGAYWLLDTPVALPDEVTRRDMVGVAASFGSVFRSYALRTFDWEFDSTSDLPRLGRLPGTFNVKGETPLPVRWRSDPNSQRYDIDTIVQETVRHGATPKPLKKSRSGKTMALNPSSSPTLTEALRRSDGRWWIGTVTQQDVKANAASMIEGCAFLRHAVDEAATLREPEWFDAMRLVARTENGDEVAHAMSAPYADYNHAKTEEKLAHAKDYDSDLTCDHIARTHVSSGCATCPFRTKLHSPADLGHRSRDHVELLVNTAYVERTDEFYDLRRVTKNGSKAESYARYHANKRLLGKPDKVITSDPIAIKAHERAYRPDKPPGTFAEGASVYLNYYVVPTHEHEVRLPRRFYRHLRYLVPDRAERKVVIRWLAQLVQRPWEKLGYALALIGGQGTGKSWLLNLMIKVLGADNVRTSGGRSVTSQFNGHFAGKVLLGLEEVTITGRAEAYEGLKALITNEIAEFERKRVQQEELQTPRGVLVLSNDAYALHLPPDDRRFFVVQTPAKKHPGGEAYYNNLFKLDDAFVASVYWSLMEVNLERFSSKTPPFVTAAKTRMADYSRADIDVMVEELVNEQRGPFSKALTTWDELRSHIRDRSNDRELTDKRIKRALEGAGVISDPQKRQCRLSAKVRSILYLIRCVDEVSNLTAIELAKAYTEKKPRFDRVIEDEPMAPTMFKPSAPANTNRL